ncbi:hypothetical protein PV08_10488 [Exophiala spinifera]|uniref:Major facilitator superfamily (MFS) profile domain-containing protein n=1 Tax=Exophiala spinifera TaxID=91928 RepID=A0A0D2AWV8_9EURO|nr:uncharacterized protein PV08_10488 [Exophiala spinifera]KIW11188.1 hypothetical protein PV08_10488 [Exophiala spinifera]
MTPQVHHTVGAPDFIPGTVHLVDLDGTIRTAHAKGKQEDVVLVPTPSKDPDDPLNWSPRRKLLFMFSLCTYILVVGIASAAIYSVLGPISADSGLSISTLVEGTGYMFLTLGWGCLILQPLAMQYGKRPIYLFSTLGTMGMMLWAPHCLTTGKWIANKCLQGFFGCVIECLCEISVADVFFAHERGAYVGVYALFLAGSNFFAPIISGFISDGQGWKWVLHWCAIFNGAGFLILFFFMEETNFHRQPLTSIEPDGGVEEYDSDPVYEKGPGSPLPSKEAATPTVESTVEEGHVLEQPAGTRSYWQKLAIYRSDPLRGKANFKGMILRPLIFASFPVIAFSGFMYGSIVCYFNILNGTSSVILSSPPYNFSPSMVGVSYVACLIGVFIGAYFSGPLGDKFILWKARRNNGIMEPEHRLWLYISLLILIPGGFLIWGIGAAHHIHWFGLVFAMGMLGCAITIGCQLPISYCIDSYKDMSGDAIVTVILIRNTMSFAVSYGVTPWMEGMGYQNAFILAAFVAMAQICLVFLFIKFGKGLRKTSVPRYWKYVNQLMAEGLVH